MSEAATSGLLPDWITFYNDYIRSGVPHLFIVRPEPAVAIFVDENAARLGARFRILDATEVGRASPLRELHFAEVVVDGKRHLEVFTDSQDLYSNFFQLASEVVLKVVGNGENPARALAGAMARWEALLSRQTVLSEERQAGLFGELWLLARLIPVIGKAALDSWVGPTGQAHDFRLGNEEVEVKTTSGNNRVHTINGVGQLEPSLNCSLHLLSLQITDAGAGGKNLADTVEAVAEALAAWPETVDRYRRLLATVGYRSDDAHLYPRRRRLRTSPLLVPIVDGVPRLTREAIAGLDARFVPERLGRITYDIDVTGLGFPDGTPEFLAVLPSA